MAEQLTPAINSGELTERIRHLELPDSRLSHVNQEPVVIAQMDGQFGEFIDTAFQDKHLGQLEAQLYDREPEGRGAHFDVYIEAIDRDYFPYIALFNLTGKVSVKAALLDEDLALLYHSNFPDPRDPGAYEARRDISRLSLRRPGTTIFEGELSPNEGLIIPQRYARHVIHDIVPTDPESPGRYLKIIAPGKSQEAGEVLRSVGYRPLDQLVMKALVDVKELPLPDDASTTAKEQKRTTPQPSPQRWSSDYDEKPPCNGFD